MSVLARGALAVLFTAAGLGGCDTREDRSAPPRVETVLMEDALLLHRGQGEARRTAEALAAHGVDRVRITAGWSVLAPHPHSRRRPHFDATDSRQYPQRGWRRLDRALAEVVRAGMRPMVDASFWAPRWAVERGTGAPDHLRWRPSPREFGLFAEALARRYDGDFRDPASGERLPAVRLWTTWNEPNLKGFLLPQWEWRDGRWETASPHHYRAMHEQAHAAIKRVSEANRVLIGGLSSRGTHRPGTRNSMPPLLFLRELACVDVELRPLRRPECRGFRPLQADGFAHHPYSQHAAPDAISQNPDHVAMGDLDRLSLVLAALHERGRLAQRLPIYITEYGYETNPPDPRRGIPLERQALYMSQAASMALGRADVRMFAQFQLRDLPQDGLYQTGLLLPDGRSKPSLLSFRLPFWVEAGLAWGQVRPERGRQRVVIERLHADGSWRPVTGELSTEADGVFRRRLGGAGTYRLRWERPDGGREWSLPVTAPS